ncbi:25293_t:CDS:2, partial [Dentiscutata erythropus]
RYAVDEEDLICWFIYGMKELCRSKVIALSLTSFETAKVVAEIMEKHWLEVENKEMIRIMNEETSETNHKDLLVFYHIEALQQNTKSSDVYDRMDIDDITETESDNANTLVVGNYDEYENSKIALHTEQLIVNLSDAHIDEYKIRHSLIIERLK